MAKFVVTLAKRTYVSLTHTCSNIVAEHFKLSWALLDATKVHEVKVILTNGAMLSRVLAFSAPRSTFSTNGVLDERNPHFGCAFGALCETHLLVFKHFKTGTALQANLSIVVRACET